MSLDNELHLWFKKRPKWIQVCVKQIIEKHKLEKEDYDDLLKLCKDEAIEGNIQISSIPHNFFIFQESTKNISLNAVYIKRIKKFFLKINSDVFYVKKIF